MPYKYFHHNQLNFLSSYDDINFDDYDDYDGYHDNYYNDYDDSNYNDDVDNY